MKVIEAEAKCLMWRHGLPVPPGSQLLREGEPPTYPAGPVAVKAQVLHGNRAQAGLVTFASEAQAADAVARIFRTMAAANAEPLVLLERQVDIAAEYYVAWRIDDLRRQAVMLFSSQGGTGVESRGNALFEYCQPPLSELHAHHLVTFLLSTGVPRVHVAAVTRFCAHLYQVFVEEDALLLEINPLAMTRQRRVVALDAKLVLDDSAAPRHLDWPALTSNALQLTDATALERAAAHAGFTFVELPGQVAVFSAGAGLGMCLIDVLADAGIPAANFSDASGGGDTDKWAEMAEIVFQRARDPEVRAILFFFTLTATSIKGVISALLQLIDKEPAPKPLVVGLVCAGAAEREMTYEQAREALRLRGYPCVTHIGDAIEALRVAISTPPEHEANHGF